MFVGATLNNIINYLKQPIGVLRSYGAMFACSICRQGYHSAFTLSLHNNITKIYKKYNSKFTSQAVPYQYWKQIQSMHHAFIIRSLHWRHNDHDGVSNHQPHGCLLQPFSQTQIKENIKAPRHGPLCGEFTAQMASNAENVSIWWRHHAWNLCQ